MMHDYHKFMQVYQFIIEWPLLYPIAILRPMNVLLL